MAETKNRNYYGIMMIITGLFFMGLHLTFVGFTNDDSYFITVRENSESLFSLIRERYLTDSSRVLSETLLFFLIDKPFIVWQILDSLICILLYHSLSVILINDKNSKMNILLFMFIASYPYMHMGSAGWICTSLNFIWPLAMLSYALSGLKRRYRKEKINAFSYLLYILALVFAVNCEQSAAATMMLFGMAYIYTLIDKRTNFYELTGLLIGIAGIIFALTAPGNGARVEMEANNWMPEFFDLTIIDKFRLCAVFVFEHFVAIPDLIFLMFSLLLALVGFKKENPLWKNIFALMPLLIDCIFTSVYFVKDIIIGHKRNYDFTTPSIYITDFKTGFIQISELLALFIFIICSVTVLCFVIKDMKEKITAIWVLATGFAVRMALMLSPTMFSSWHRTLIYLYFAFIYASFVLLKELYKKNIKSWQKILVVFCLIAGIIVNLILTVGLQIRKSAIW